jgi:hypothetical protein
MAYRVIGKGETDRGSDALMILCTENYRRAVLSDTDNFSFRAMCQIKIYIHVCLSRDRAFDIYRLDAVQAYKQSNLNYLFSRQCLPNGNLQIDLSQFIALFTRMACVPTILHRLHRLHMMFRLPLNISPDPPNFEALLFVMSHITLWLQANAGGPRMNELYSPRHQRGSRDMIAISKCTLSSVAVSSIHWLSMSQ